MLQFFSQLEDLTNFQKLYDSNKIGMQKENIKIWSSSILVYLDQ